MKVILDFLIVNPYSPLNKLTQIVSAPLLVWIAASTAGDYGLFFSICPGVSVNPDLATSVLHQYIDGGFVKPLVTDIVPILGFGVYILEA